MSKPNPAFPSYIPINPEIFVAEEVAYSALDLGVTTMEVSRGNTDVVIDMATNGKTIPELGYLVLRPLKETSGLASSGRYFHVPPEHTLGDSLQNPHQLFHIWTTALNEGSTVLHVPTPIPTEADIAHGVYKAAAEQFGKSKPLSNLLDLVRLRLPSTFSDVAATPPVLLNRPLEAAMLVDQSI